MLLIFIAFKYGWIIYLPTKSLQILSTVGDITPIRALQASAVISWWLFCSWTRLSIKLSGQIFCHRTLEMANGGPFVWLARGSHWASNQGPAVQLNHLFPHLEAGSRRTANEMRPWPEAQQSPHPLAVNGQNFCSVQKPRPSPTENSGPPSAIYRSGGRKRIVLLSRRRATRRPSL